MFVLLIHLPDQKRIPNYDYCCFRVLIFSLSCFRRTGTNGSNCETLLDENKRPYHLLVLQVECGFLCKSVGDGFLALEFETTVLAFGAADHSWTSYNQRTIWLGFMPSKMMCNCSFVASLLYPGN